MTYRLPLLALLLTFTHSVGATDHCPSDFWVHAKCVPDALVTEALQEATNKSFVEMMRLLYEKSALATGTKDDVFELPADASQSAWVQIFPGWSGIFGAQEIEPARSRQLTIFTAYCSSNLANIKRVDTSGTSKERITAFCVDNNGKAIAGLFVLPPQKDRLLETKKNFQAHYFPPYLAQRVLDFWANIKSGDKTHRGMVIEVKPPIAKVQLPRGEERWFEVETLLPKDL